MTPEQFFDQIQEKKRTEAAALAETAAAEIAEQQAAEVAIRVAAAQLMPQFLVNTLTFDWRGFEGYEQCAELQHEQISGIRIWFQYHKAGWKPGHWFVPAKQEYDCPFQVCQNKDGRALWVDQFSEDFAEIWLLAVAEKEKQTAIPSMPVYPHKMLIQAAEQMDNISQSYRVEFTAEQAVVFLETADPHCECWSANIADFVRAINKAVPPMQFGAGNPNNGNSHHVFLVGREYSRVIYLDIAKAYLRGIQDYTILIQQLKEIGQNHHAYEIDVQRNDDAAIAIRYWWKRCEMCE